MYTVCNCTDTSQCDSHLTPNSDCILRSGKVQNIVYGEECSVYPKKQEADPANNGAAKLRKV